MSRTNKQVIADFAAALFRGDLDLVKQLMHPDFFIHEAESLPYGGVHRGLEGILTVFKGINSSWANVSNNVLEIHGQPNDSQFFMMADLSGTSHKTGRSFKISVLERYVVEDGKLKEIHPHYFDTKAVWDVDQD